MGKQKSTEMRMRRTLHRRGYRLRKSGRRDPLAPDYGGYWIEAAQSDGSYRVVAGGEHGIKFDEVVAWVESMGSE